MGGEGEDSWFPQGLIDIEMFWDGGEARETCGGFDLLWDGETVPGFSIKPAGKVDDRSYNEGGGNRGTGDGQSCKGDGRGVRREADFQFDVRVFGDHDVDIRELFVEVVCIRNERVEIHAGSEVGVFISDVGGGVEKNISGRLN